MKTHQGRLSAGVPDDWFVKESITLLAPSGRANVIASSEPLDPSIGTDLYAQIQGDLLRREFPGFREVSFEPTIVFGRHPGHLRHFSWTPPDGVQVTQLQLYFVEAGRGFTATATTPTAGFASIEAELRQVLGALGVHA